MRFGVFAALLALAGCAKETAIHIQPPSEAKTPPPAKAPQQTRMPGAGNIADVMLSQDNAARRKLEKERMDLEARFKQSELDQQKKKLEFDTAMQKKQAEAERQQQEALAQEKEALRQAEQAKKLRAKMDREQAEIKGYVKRNYKDSAGCEFYPPHAGTDKKGDEGTLYLVRIKSLVIDYTVYKKVPRYQEVVFFLKNGLVAGSEKAVDGYNSLKKYTPGEEIEVPAPAEETSR
jgi:hypothetical protein